MIVHFAAIHFLCCKYVLFGLTNNAQNDKILSGISRLSKSGDTVATIGMVAFNESIYTDMFSFFFSIFTVDYFEITYN